MPFCRFRHHPQDRLNPTVGAWHPRTDCCILEHQQSILLSTWISFSLGKTKGPRFRNFLQSKKKVWKIQWEQKDFPEKAEFEGLDYSWFGEPNN